MLAIPRRTVKHIVPTATVEATRLRNVCDPALTATNLDMAPEHVEGMKTGRIDRHDHLHILIAISLMAHVEEMIGMREISRQGLMLFQYWKTPKQQHLLFQLASQDLV